jgi:hypothetical protein
VRPARRNCCSDYWISIGSPNSKGHKHHMINQTEGIKLLGDCRQTLLFALSDIKNIHTMSEERCGLCVTIGISLYLSLVVQPSLSLGLFHNFLPFTPLQHQYFPVLNTHSLHFFLYFLNPSPLGSSRRSFIQEQVKC